MSESTDIMTEGTPYGEYGDMSKLPRVFTDSPGSKHKITREDISLTPLVTRYLKTGELPEDPITRMQILDSVE